MNKKVTPVKPGAKKPPSGRVYSTYDQNYQKDPAYIDKQVTRNRDRRKAQEEGRVAKGSGKDVHHVKGAANGGPDAGHFRLEEQEHEMTLQFPIPQFIGEAVRYQGYSWVWDGVGWYVDDTANRLDLSVVPAYLGQFVHIVPGTLPIPTFISLSDPDLYGASYILTTTPPLEGLKVYKSGELLVMDDGSGLVGTYVVNRAANRVEFLVPLVSGDTITIGVLTPSDNLAPGRVDVQPIKDLDTDWVTNPGSPTTGMVDGVRRTFDLLYDRAGVGQEFAVVGSDSELAVFVAGVRQQPGVDYIAVGSELTMTVAPIAGVPFWALWYRPAGSAGSGGVTPPQPPLDGRVAYYGWQPGVGASWQDARGVAITVADAAARAALRPDIELIAGRLVHQADTDQLWRWTGAVWGRYLDSGTFTAALGGRMQSLRSTTALQRPAAASLLPGELWVNMTDRVFGFGSAAGDPVELLPRVAVSAGAPDAGKLPVLGAGGVLDRSFFTAGLQPYGTVDLGAIALTDWNNAHLNGTTTVRAPAGTANRPPGADIPFAGQYIAMGDANTGILTVFSPQGSTVFARARSAGAWGAWVQVNSPGLDISSAMLRANNLSDVVSKPASRANLQVPYLAQAAYVGDLNAITETGLYPLGVGVTNGWTAGTTGTGGEAGVGDEVLHLTTGVGLGFQMGFNVKAAAPAAQPLRCRFTTAANVWTPWVGIQTSDEVTAAINAAVAAAIAALPPGTAFIGATPPPTPVAGQFWYNTTTQGLFVFRTDTDPDSWVQTWVDPADPPPATHVGDAPPPGPEQGQLWYKTSDPVGLFVWYVDADSSQWVSVGGSGGPAFATTAEAKAGTVTDKVMSPALVQARSGLQVLPLAGLAAATFDQVPAEACEIDLTFNGVSYNTGRLVYLDFAGAPGARAWSTRVRSSTAYSAPSGDDDNTRFVLDSSTATTWASGLIRLARNEPGGSWFINGSLRFATNNMMQYAGVFTLYSALVAQLRVNSDAAFVGGWAHARWRI